MGFEDRDLQTEYRRYMRIDQDIHEYEYFSYGDNIFKEQNVQSAFPYNKVNKNSFSIKEILKLLKIFNKSNIK